MTREKFDLVIFDCDGVLIDSERLAVTTEQRVLAELGWELDVTEIIDRFVGRSADYMLGEVERHLGRKVDWDAEFESQYKIAFERELQPVTGVEAAIEGLDVPTCVASSSGLERLRYTLGLTGLYERFLGRIFSAEQVDHGKPAPDLFLFAASAMGASPERCVVVEDSVSGVRAGVAAGMRVLGYTGSVTSAGDLHAAGATTFDHMDQLPELVGP